jgi:hypothetical protein
MPGGMLEVSEALNTPPAKPVYSTFGRSQFPAASPNALTQNEGRRRQAQVRESFSRQAEQTRGGSSRNLASRPLCNAQAI